ncbi:hypothetical protein [Actinomadura rugatobispora]|uniref:LemA family protein n=1 Tax=Actinomadura rugatobispora TaxID=1994 RepID=A0ABW1AK32_9ACTN|nr:hypothetical protein GCM10010200_048720 [Actinomadura rugatobispora]
MSVGDVLSIAGLAVAMWQIWRMGRIVTATKKAVDDATQRIGVYNLLLMVPKLSRLEHDIENAAIRKNVEEMRRLLREWREAASSLRGILASDHAQSSALDALAQESINLAALAKTNLVGKENVDLPNATKRVRKAIEKVCLETSMLASQITSTATPFGARQVGSGDQSSN